MAKGLTRDILVGTALSIVDREGLGALSMRRLGAELGVDPMAAYRHLPNKEALLDGVVEAIVAEIDLDVDDTLPWQEQIARLARANLDAISAHPNAALLLARRPLATPRSLLLVEKALQVMSDAGVPLRDAVLAVNALGPLTVGIVLAGGSRPRVADETAAAEAAARSVESLPVGEFPCMREAVDTRQFLRGYDEVFEFALAALIDRLEGAREMGGDSS